jgi:hypothetical protein
MGIPLTIAKGHSFAERLVSVQTHPIADAEQRQNKTEFQGVR